MTGLEFFLLLYLGGFMGTSSTLIAKDCSPPPRVLSRGECVALGLIGGVVWPVGVYEAVKND